MTFNKQGITTGLMGYSLRKELFSDSIPFREVETFNFEVYSSDNANQSPLTIQSGIYSEFVSKYSGDINVKVFNVPAEYVFPNDSIRSAKFIVQVEIRHSPSSLTGFNELSGSFYSGLDGNFFNQYASTLVDFKEDFSFEKGENGNHSLSHEVSFALMTGSKPLATQIISGIYSTDYNLPFGMFALSGSMTGANPNTVQDYYTESFDLIRNSYSFSKKREFLPYDASSFDYNLNHSMNLNENGVFDITEKCDLKGKISFLQAQQGLNLVYAGSQSRCNNFYNTFSSYISQPGEPPSTAPISSTPRKLNQVFDKPSFAASYEVTFTNDPEFTNSGYSQKHIIELEVNQKNIVNISDKYTYTFNKRSPSFGGAYNLLSGTYNTSPTVASGYYANSSYYQSTWPLRMTNVDLTWPYNLHQSNITLDYSNDPRNNVVIGGLMFNTLDVHVENVQPVDIIQEYKIINRPNKLSVLNYAYQTEKGMINVSIDASIGRLSNEFVNGFRTDLTQYVSALYTYGINKFVENFTKMSPINFTYYLSDVKYSLNNDGNVNMTLEFSYTVKKYLM